MKKDVAECLMKMVTIGFLKYFPVLTRKRKWLIKKKKKYRVVALQK